MEKVVQCRHWKEYQGLNGWIMFCGAGAFAKRLSIAEAESCGCTVEQRAACRKIMKSNIGYGLVPDVGPEEKQQQVTRRDSAVAVS